MHESIRVLTTRDEADIRKLLLVYLDEEPTSKCVGLSSQEKEIFVKLNLKKVVPQGFSLGVFSAHSDELCACSLVSDRIYDTDADNKFNENTPGLNKLVKFDDFMLGEAPQLVQNQRYFHLEAIVVLPKYQRLGFATVLTQRSEDMALKNNHTILVLVANSEKSQRSVKKCGFKFYKKVLYKDYKDPMSGEQTFRNIPPPHTGAVLCYKQLSVKQKM